MIKAKDMALGLVRGTILPMIMELIWSQRRNPVSSSQEEEKKEAKGEEVKTSVHDID